MLIYIYIYCTIFSQVTLYMFLFYKYFSLKIRMPVKINHNYNAYTRYFTKILFNIQVSNTFQVPSEPPLNLRAEPSPDSAILRWDPPAEKDQNGVITGYLIKYQLSSDPSSQMTRTVGAVNQLSLDNLMTEMTYGFTVAAINSNGTGPDATMVMFTTIPDGKISN